MRSIWLLPLGLDAYRQFMYVYVGFYVCCSDSVGSVLWNVCCVSATVKVSGCLALAC